MITEIVTFALPEGLTREQLLLNYRMTAEKWRQNPDLIHKQYFYHRDQHMGGAIYLWKSMAAAQQSHGEEFRKMVLKTYGSEPSIQYVEGLLVVDNLAGKVYEDPCA